MTEHRYVVIMAGGSGTRLWPLSRQNRPKQMLAFAGERTLFQLAVDRLGGVVEKNHIFVVTVADQTHQLQASLPEIPAENYLIEPMPRGTASVVGLAAIALSARDPQASMAVVTADHLIKNVDYFKELLEAGFDVAQKGYLVTLGITPTAPMTGYGYIQRGEVLGNSGGKVFYRVARFKEKPNLETAVQFMQDGDHYWNSGMFIWTVRRILAEFEQSMAELWTKLQAIAAAWSTPKRDSVVQALWPTIQPQSIDFGIMEKAQQVAVIPAEDLGWSDVGSWESLYDALPGDGKSNVILARNHFGIDTASTLVLSNQPERMIVTVGVEDLVVIDTGDALLICKRSESQKVRDAVEHLKKNNLTHYL